MQRVGPAWPEKNSVNGLIRADQAFLVIELVLIALLLINLHTSTASHAVAAGLLMGGPDTWAFWGVVVGLGILLRLALQALELEHRIPHTVVSALLVLAGGYTLRWVMVNAGQMSEIARAVALVPWPVASWPVPIPVAERKIDVPHVAAARAVDGRQFVGA